VTRSIAGLLKPGTSREQGALAHAPDPALPNPHGIGTGRLLRQSAARLGRQGESF
jgi:hypothetical protein